MSEILPMKRDWVTTEFGMDLAAIGLVAVCIGVPLIVLQDIWFVATGVSPTLWLYDRVLSYAAAAVAAVFSVVNIFVFRPGLPKWVAAVVAISLASYVIQPLLPVHGCRQVAVLCVVRTVGCCTLLLLARRYVLDSKAEKVAR